MYETTAIKPHDSISYDQLTVSYNTIMRAATTAYHLAWRNLQNQYAKLERSNHSPLESEQLVEAAKTYAQAHRDYKLLTCSDRSTLRIYDTNMNIVTLLYDDQCHA